MVCVQVGYDLGLFDDEMFQIVLWMKPVKKGICEVSTRWALMASSCSSINLDYPWPETLYDD